MILSAKVHRFGDNINTDYIISSRNKAKSLDLDELARHVFEDIDPGFLDRFRPGDAIVAGENFGCGSSRETAPAILQRIGVSAVIAKSFARIYFRNSVNIALPALICNTDEVEDGAELEIDPGSGRVEDRSHGLTLTCEPYPPFMLRIIKDGGLAAHLRLHGTYQTEDLDG
jgi:3-isopropylmalate/(R)-2-methylmalate dehydratase small subunit